MSPIVTSVATEVAKYSPLLGELIPIPGSQYIIKAIADLFGGSPSNPDELAQKINQDPDAQLKLETLKSNERVEIDRLTLEKIKAANQELADARARETSLKDKTPALIAKIFIGSYLLLTFSLIVAMACASINDAEEKLILEVMKDMSLAVMLILAYYFGSSNQFKG